MRNVRLVVFVVPLVFAGLASGGWWPPPTEMSIDPENPSASDFINITIGGDWPCASPPRYSSVSLDGTDIFFDIWPIIMGGLWMITPWEESQTVGPLSAGTYSVYLTPDGGTPAYMGDFSVTDKQFSVSVEELSVSEGGMESFTVELISDPCGTVEVTVARDSGDSDIMVALGGTLTFDSSDFFVPQPVTIAALEDEDYFHGAASIVVSAPNYVSSLVSVSEIDNDSPSVLYVDANAGGEGQGRSWADALLSLQDALGIARVVPEVNEIRVAGGIYRPDAGQDVISGDRNATLQLVADVAVRGGYGGLSRPNPDVRDIGKYESVLSGDLNGNDGPNFANTGDNSRNVVHGRSRAILDGFTITGGSGDTAGGGIRNQGASTTILNCIIKNNRAGYGGGLYNHGGSLTLVNCIFIGNKAHPNTIGDGGGMYTTESNCSPMLINCTFVGNSANEAGGGLCSYSSGTTVTNCIFWGNTDAGGSDQSAQIHSSSVAVSYCCVKGWTGTLGGTGNFDADPLFADSGVEDYHLKSEGGRWDANEGGWVIDALTSPCIDAGDPMSPIGLEPFPNGGIVNMGAFGGTGEASKSYFGKAPCETIIAGDMNGDCEIDLEDFRLMALHWYEDNTP